MLSDQFTAIFRAEHRKVRDLLFELKAAFAAKDRNRIESLVYNLSMNLGPHLRYEEETIYPLLADALGAEYLEHLLAGHDRAILNAERVVEIAQAETMTDADVAEADRLLQAALPHITDCDGLSLMVETLPEEKIRAILEARSQALQTKTGLLEWARGERGRTLSPHAATAEPAGEPRDG